MGQEQKKLLRLKQDLQSMKKVIIAFSGGVDSTFLLRIAQQELGDQVLAITAKSSTFPERELNLAIEFCKLMGIKHMVIESEELDDPEFCKNPVNRCYLCKKQLFGKIIDLAKQQGFDYIVDGSNLDDTKDYRPGRQALEEFGIQSPLMQAGFTKEDIRKISHQLGLNTWDKPSFACLSSRFPYGEEITREKLKMVEQAEQYLLDLGFRQVRVRHHGDIARIELSPEENYKIFENNLAVRIDQTFREYGFVYTTLDLKGYRTGSMNAKIT